MLSAVLFIRDQGCKQIDHLGGSCTIQSKPGDNLDQTEGRRWETWSKGRQDAQKIAGRCEWRRRGYWKLYICIWETYLSNYILEFFFFCFFPLVIHKVLTKTCPSAILWAKVGTRESRAALILELTAQRETPLFQAHFMQSWTCLFTHLPAPTRQYRVRAAGGPWRQWTGLPFLPSGSFPCRVT